MGGMQIMKRLNKLIEGINSLSVFEQPTTEIHTKDLKLLTEEIKRLRETSFNRSLDIANLTRDLAKSILDRPPLLDVKI